jgi:hypothetical protein
MERLKRLCSSAVDLNKVADNTDSVGVILIEQFTELKVGITRSRFRIMDSAIT